MSLSVPTPGEIFMLRTHKRLVSNPLLSWINTYEFISGSTTDFVTLHTMAGSVLDMEYALHLVDVEFFQYALSTWVSDGSPYNPGSFVVVPLEGQFGTRSASSPMALENCLKVTRKVSTGRQGMIFYRRVLAEGDVESPSGVQAFSGGVKAAMQAIINTAIGDGLEDWLAGDALTTGKLCMHSTLSTRLITDFVADKPAIVKYNHRYFDRSP